MTKMELSACIWIYLKKHIGRTCLSVSHIILRAQSLRVIGLPVAVTNQRKQTYFKCNKSKFN